MTVPMESDLGLVLVFSFVHGILSYFVQVGSKGLMGFTSFREKKNSECSGLGPG